MKHSLALHLKGKMHYFFVFQGNPRYNRQHSCNKFSSLLKFSFPQPKSRAFSHIYSLSNVLGGSFCTRCYLVSLCASDQLPKHFDAHKELCQLVIDISCFSDFFFQLSSRAEPQQWLSSFCHQCELKVPLSYASAAYVHGRNCMTLCQHCIPR